MVEPEREARIRGVAVSIKEARKRTPDHFPGVVDVIVHTDPFQSETDRGQW